MNPLDLQEHAWIVRQWARRAAEQLAEQRLGWQGNSRDLQKFWEEATVTPSNLLHHLSQSDRSALRDAARALEVQADAARADLLRVQHAAGAIAHALGATAISARS